MPLPASLRLSSVASPTMWNFRASPVCASDSFFHLRSHRILALSSTGRTDATEIAVRFIGRET